MAGDSQTTNIIECRKAIELDYSFIEFLPIETILISCDNQIVLAANELFFKRFSLFDSKIYGHKLSNIDNKYFENLAKKIEINSKTQHNSSRHNFFTAGINHSVNVKWVKIDSKFDAPIYCIQFDFINHEDINYSLTTQQLIDTSPIGIALIDSEGKIHLVSNQMRKTFNINQTEKIEGQYILNYVAEEHIGKVHDRLMDIFKKLGESTINEFVLKKGTGEKFWAEVFSYHISEVFFEKPMLMVYVQDISSRKKVDLEMRDTISMLTSTLNSTDNGILVVSNEGKVSGFNKKFSEIWDIPLNILITRDDASFLNHVLKKVKNPEHFLSRVNQLYSNDEVVSKEIIELVDGRVLSRYSEPQRIGDQIIGRVWSFLDISSEEKLKRAKAEIEESLLFIAEKPWIKAEEDFLISLTNFICLLLDVDLCFIGELVNDNESIKSQAVSHNGKQGTPFQFNVFDTPCYNFNSKEKCSISNGLANLYPQSALVRKYGGDSFVGFRLESSKSKPIGEIVIMHSKPLENIERYENIISLFRISAAAELEQRQTNRLLDEEQTLISSTIDSIPGIFFVCNASNGKLVRWNQGFEEITGHEKEHESSKVIEEYFTHDKESMEKIKCFVESKKPNDSDNFRVVMRNRKGLYIPIQLAINRLTIEETNFFVGIGVDISEKEKAEAGLKRSETLFRTMFESSQDAIFLMNNGRFIDCNPAALIMFECNKDEMIGKSPVDFSPFRQKNGIDSHKLANKKINNVLEGKRENFKWTHIRNRSKVKFQTFVKLDLLRINNISLILAVVHDISEQVLHEAELMRTQENLKKFARHLQNVREEERKYISRELHDNLGQNLTALKIDIHRLNKKATLNDPSQLPIISEMSGELLRYSNTIIEQVRKMSRELRPAILDQLGLISAMEFQAKDFNEKTGINCQFTSNVSNLNINQEESIAIYRIVQESLTNIYKHAKAKNVEIHFNTTEKSLMLEVRDDGIGIKTASISGEKSLGLLSMQERAILLNGNFKIAPCKKGGTLIKVEIPVQNQKQSEDNREDELENLLR